MIITHFMTINCNNNSEKNFIAVMSVSAVGNDVYVLIKGLQSYVNVYDFEHHALKRTIMLPKKVALTSNIEHQLCITDKYVYIVYYNGLIVLNRTCGIMKNTIDIDFTVHAIHKS